LRLERLNSLSSITQLPFSLRDLEGIARGAAALVRGHYGRVDFEEKADGSPITKADRECNQYLEHQLLQLLPLSGWLSEETEDAPSRLTHDWVWVVDPIDGTKEFVARVPEFAVSVGLVFREIVVGGFVVNPALDQGGVAGVGQSLRHWGLEITPQRKIQNPLEAVVSVSRTESSRGATKGLEEVIGEIRPVGSIAYKMLRVAVGAEDATISFDAKSEWDLCGGVALLKAAGKKWKSRNASEKFNQPDPRRLGPFVGGPASLVDSLFEIACRRAKCLS
jgi:myo-inositol-1(or 4)-monophosphatase